VVLASWTAPGSGTVVIDVGRELVRSRYALLERLLTVALEHQIGGTPDIDLSISGIT
jgi:hypothetical protein